MQFEVVLQPPLLQLNSIHAVLQNPTKELLAKYLSTCKRFSRLESICLLSLLVAQFLTSARALKYGNPKGPPLPSPPACLSANRNICCAHASCKSICDFHFCLPQLSASTPLLVTSYACSALRISLLRYVLFKWTFAARGLKF